MFMVQGLSCVPTPHTLTQALSLYSWNVTLTTEVVLTLYDYRAGTGFISAMAEASGM
jgi:hypothetical protein